MKIVNVNLPAKSYSIIIKKGLLSSIGKEIKKIHKNKKIVIITDQHVHELYGNDLRQVLAAEGYELEIIILKAGEGSKSLSVLQYIYDRLLAFGITREDVIVSLGGGVVGDISGFAAATFLRGIKYFHVPTTLLAQIDSSIGGKVAINLPQGKNLVGSFYHPEAVFIDPLVLSTLNNRTFAEGMAEVIKYGLINDESLFWQLWGFADKQELTEKIDDIIYQCCRIKQEVVEADERDNGIRMLLNFGHTLGHAVEQYFNYEKYTHGEAVSIGMAHLTEKTEFRGETEKGSAELVRKILCKYGLPVELPCIETEGFLSAIMLDKKNKGKALNLVFLKKIGEAYIKEIEIEQLKMYI